MAEYLPIFKPGRSFTLQASGTITGGNLLYISGSGTVAATSGATVPACGVAGNDAASGDKVTVYCGGVQLVTASGTVTAGDFVHPAASGQVATHTGGTNDYQVVGIAQTTATTGNKVRIQFFR
jgi:hypothetical protein